jgi:Fur family peroxide stress response transcriptional regulator
VNAAQIQRFREACTAAGLAATHQRLVIFEALESMPGHPSPEDVYLRVKRRIPSVSLATVYKNLHLFIESGIFHEVSVHHGSLRVETNKMPHHHLVCRSCKSITDIGQEELGLLAQAGRLPGGFKVERYAVDAVGVCVECQKKAS